MIHAGAQSVLIVQPTGCGKTRTAVEACFGHVKLGGVPMFVAPRRELVSQASERARRARARAGA
jgi:superfamily II DNA or RNA helicase